MAKITKAMIATVLAIAASETGFAMLTQGEGADVVGAGLATVDTSNVDGDKAAVSLTEEGAKLAAENAPAPAGQPAASSGFEIDDAVAIPADSARRSREGGYPFDKLEVGQSFHVAKSVANPDPVTRLQSSVSGARAKFSVETGETETVTVKEYQRGPDGKGYAKDGDGKRIVATTKTVSRAKMVITRDFTVKAVDASDPRGEGARVWRTA
jgi:hypothetical protein